MKEPLKALKLLMEGDFDALSNMHIQEAVQSVRARMSHYTDEERQEIDKRLHIRLSEPVCSMKLKGQKEFDLVEHRFLLIESTISDLLEAGFQDTALSKDISVYELNKILRLAAGSLCSKHAENAISKNLYDPELRKIAVRKVIKLFGYFPNLATIANYIQHQSYLLDKKSEAAEKPVS